MLRIASGLRAHSLRTQVRCYSGGFEISDYLSRIEAITKSRKPQNKGGVTQGKKPAGQVQNKQRPPQSQRGPRPPVRGNRSGQDDTRTGANSGQKHQPSRRPRTTGSRARQPPAQVQVAITKPVEQSLQPSVTASAESFTPLSAISQQPLPKGGRRRTASALRVPRTRPKGGRRRTGAQKPNEAALMARRALQATEQDTSFLHPQEALEILVRNENTTVNGFISVDDVSLQALQPNIVSSAVSYNSRVRSLLRDLPDNLVSDRERLGSLVRARVQGLYDEGIILEAKGGSVSTEGLVKVLNANPSYSGEKKQLLASIGTGKVPIKQIARSV